MSRNSEEYYNQGIKQYEDAQYELSIENFKKAIAINDDIFDYHYNLGLAYLKTEQNDLAIESFNNGIGLNSRDYEIYLNLGLAFYNKKEYPKAIKAYNKAINLNSGDAENFNSAGIAYCALKNYKDAIYNFKLAVKLEPKMLNYNYNLAYAYYEYEKYEAAEDCLVKLINYSKDDPEAYVLLGKVYLKQYDRQLAKDNFEKALKIDPDHKEALAALQEVNLKLARRAKNKDAVQETPPEIPEEIPPANVPKLPEEPEEPEKPAPSMYDLRTKLQQDPENKEARESVWNLINELNFSPELILQYLKKSEACIKNNDFICAMAFIKRAMELSPGNEKIKILLARVTQMNNKSI